MAPGASQVEGMNTQTMFAASLGLVACSLSLVTGCASMGFGYSEAELKKAVAFETGCAQEKVEIVEAMEGGTGHTKFKVKACGEDQRWNRYGASYYPQGKGPMDGK